MNEWEWKPVLCWHNTSWSFAFIEIIYWKWLLHWEKKKLYLSMMTDCCCFVQFLHWSLEWWWPAENCWVQSTIIIIWSFFFKHDPECIIRVRIFSARYSERICYKGRYFFLLLWCIWAESVIVGSQEIQILINDDFVGMIQWWVPFSFVLVFFVLDLIPKEVCDVIFNTFIVWYINIFRICYHVFCFLYNFHKLTSVFFQWMTYWLAHRTSAYVTS